MHARHAELVVAWPTLKCSFARRVGAGYRVRAFEDVVNATPCSREQRSIREIQCAGNNKGTLHIKQYIHGMLHYKPVDNREYMCVSTITIKL